MRVLIAHHMRCFAFRSSHSPNAAAHPSPGRAALQPCLETPSSVRTATKDFRGTRDTRAPGQTGAHPYRQLNARIYQPVAYPPVWKLNQKSCRTGENRRKADLSIHNHYQRWMTVPYRGLPKNTRSGSGNWASKPSFVANGRFEPLYYAEVGHCRRRKPHCSDEQLHRIFRSQPANVGGDRLGFWELPWQGYNSRIP